MKIFVTGAAGFIGSYVSRALVLRGDDVVGYDNFHSYYPRNCKEFNVDLTYLAAGRKTRFFPQQQIEPIYKKLDSISSFSKSDKKTGYYEFVEGDIVNYDFLEYLFDKEKFDAVIHLAAMAGVPFSIRDPRLYTSVNLDGTTNLLNLSTLNNIKNFVFASSSSVYGNSDKVPFKENELENKPISPYAATKLAGEVLCHTFNYNFGLNISCLRFFTVYGPLQRPYGMAIQRFVNYVFRDIPLTIFGDGSMARDYTYVEDTVKGILGALDNVQKYEIYNLGNSAPVTLNNLVKEIEAAVGKKAIITNVDRPSTEVNITFADITKANKMFGYKPTMDVSEGIKRQVEVYRMMPEWYRNLAIV